MKKIQYAISTAILSLISTIYAAAQSGTDTVTKSMNSVTSDNPQAGNISGIVIGVGAVLILGVVIYFMFRNRNKTIGGIQSQDKPSPTPPTTQSINNPGSGI